MQISELESIGLTKNESITYLTLLKLGPSKTGNILKQSGLNSGKIYEILESLKIKGLVSEISQDNVKQFTAAPPDQLMQYMELKKLEIKKQEKTITKLLPDLKTIQESNLPKKRIATYSGFRGVITAAEEALNQTPNNEEIVSLGISDVNAWSQEYWHKWEVERKRKKIKARYILSQKGIIYDDLMKIGYVDVKIIEADTPVGIDIYGKDIMLIIHYQEPVSATIIYDKHTVTTFKSYFEVLWAQAKK